MDSQSPRQRPCTSEYTLMTTLGKLRPSQSGRIVSVQGNDAITGRLLALGLLPGANVRVLGVAPLGDPMMVQLDGCRMSLRKVEAESLTIEPA